MLHCFGLVSPKAKDIQFNVLEISITERLEREFSAVLIDCQILLRLHKARLAVYSLNAKLS